MSENSKSAYNRVFVFSLGFHEDFVLRRLYSHGAGRGDKIILVTVEPAVSGVLKAYDSIKGFVARLGLQEPLLLEIPGGDLARATSMIADAIRKTGCSYVVADVTGGTRFSGLAVFLGVLSSGIDGEVWVQSESGGAWEARVPLGVLRLLRQPLSPEKQKLLEAIGRNPGLRPEDLASDLGVAVKTILNHLAELKKLGLVYQKGRGGGVYLSDWGTVFSSTGKGISGGASSTGTSRE